MIHRLISIRATFFGEMGPFRRGSNRSRIAAPWSAPRATCEVAEVSYSKFRRIEPCRNPESALRGRPGKWLKGCANTTRKVVTWPFSDVTRRVARTLLDLCNSPSHGRTPRRYADKVTRQEIAASSAAPERWSGACLKAWKNTA